MRRFREIRSTTWLLVSGFVSLCLISLLLLSISLILLRSANESREMHKIDANMRVAWELLRNLGDDIHLQNGELFAGSTPLAGNSTLVDRIQAVVGGAATVFKGDVRIATNVRDKQGQRGVNTRLAVAEVRNAVLEQGKPFRGVVDVLGVEYYAGYDPIRDSSGAVIGILYVGDEASGVLDAVSRRTEWMLGLPAAAVVLIGAMFVLVGGRLTKQIEARQESLQATHAQLDTALASMASGLAMWSAEGRLLLFNDRLNKVLGNPTGRLQEGMDLHEFLRHRYEVSDVGDANFDAYQRDHMDRMARKEAHGSTEHGRDGRTLSVLHRPTADNGWVTTYEDVTERHAANAKISFMAHYDPLTGLANRTLYDQRLAQALESGKACGGRVAVFGLDLDQFKPVNDTLGHAAGDKLLMAVSKRLSALLRETDLLARLGGDEFAIMLPLAAGSESGHLSLAQRIVTALAEPFSIDDQSIVIGVSVGVAMYPGDADTGSELLRCADIAMYRAKQDGRNTFRLFEPVMDESLQERRRLERDLRLAVEAEAFELHYQPIVCCSTGAVEGYEALVRWTHPMCGAVPPSVFVPLAEETNQMLKLGRWVMDTACRAATAWEDGARVAVNLSPVQFRQADLADMILTILAGAGLDPARLEVEITEGVLIEDADRAIEVLTKLRSAGVRISLDDFGTGYSSLSYLRRFPLDKIKIDKSFIDEMASDPQSASIVEALVSLAHTLQLSVVAEGVETPDQYGALRRHFCDQVQGYLLGRPAPATLPTKAATRQVMAIATNRMKKIVELH